MRSGVIAAAAAIGLAGSVAAQPGAHNDGRDFHTLDNPVGDFQAVGRDSGPRPNVTGKATSVFQDSLSEPVGHPGMGISRREIGVLIEAK